MQLKLLSFRFKLRYSF